MGRTMTDDEKWDALRKTALSDHEPFCNYGQTNGREMCTCQILVDLVEGNQDDPTFKERLEAAYEGPIRGPSEAAAKRMAAGNGAKPARASGGSRSDQRARRLAERRVARNRADAAKAHTTPRRSK